MNLSTAAITLIIVMDPLGNIPVFLSILKPFDVAMQKRIIIRESLIALLVLIIFLFFGPFILKGLQITTSALSIAGGIILFLIALRMIFPTTTKAEPIEEEPFIVPLAVPLTAGPSAIATVMLFVSQEPHKIWIWLLAIFIAFLFCLSVFMLAPLLFRLLGVRGLTAVERLMGMILTTVAIQMLMVGIANYRGLLALG